MAMGIWVGNLWLCGQITGLCENAIRVEWNRMDTSNGNGNMDGKYLVVWTNWIGLCENAIGVEWNRIDTSSGNGAGVAAGWASRTVQSLR